MFPMDPKPVHTSKTINTNIVAILGAITAAFQGQPIEVWGPPVVLAVANIGLRFLTEHPIQFFAKG